jgi:dTDP-4-dehydrorhamnose 3,5-epimerase
LALVEVDDWENPSPDLVPEVFELSEAESKIVCVPEGYANCIKAHEKDSVLLVFSGKILEEALKDSWRYDKSMWSKGIF